MKNRLVLIVGADCYLTGVSRELLDAVKTHLTVVNPKYRDARKYGRWIGKKLKPYLYFFEQEVDGIRFPRGFGNQSVRLCRKYTGTSPEIIDNRRTTPPCSFTFSGDLRPYQKEAFDAVVERDFGVVEAGTGSGKTVIALAVIAERSQPTLVLVHTKELLYQWSERVRNFLNIEAGLIGDGHFEIQPVTIAIVNSARNRLDELPLHFGHIVVDECHRVPASLFTDVVTAFDCKYSLGLSATAFRRDGLTNLINFYLGESAHKVDADKLYSTGAVLQPEFIQKPTEFHYGYRGKYQDLMKALINNKERNRQIVSDIAAEVGQGRGTVLVVSDRVAHCESLSVLLAGYRIKAPVLTGRTAADERAKLVEAIRNNRVKVVISTVQLIGEGFDCPGLMTLFLTTPIKFTGRLLQVVGRILRPAEGKQARVYDYIDPVGVLKSSARVRRLTFD